MSLLLEALKKAEQAKQGETTQQTGAGGGSGIPAGEGLSLAPEDAPPGRGTSQPITRDRLPDITQNLEILSDELGAGGSPTASRDTSTAPGTRPGRAPRTPASRTPERDLDSEREAARQLFEAHTVDYDPRRPFKLVLVGLGVFAIGVVVYFWWQLQPHSVGVVQSPPPSQQIAATAPPPAPSPTPVPQSEPTPPLVAPDSTSTTVGSTAGTPGVMEPSAAEAAVPTPPQPMPTIRPTPRPAQPTPRTRAATADEEPLPGARGTMSIRRTQSGVDDALKRGFAALQAGDLAAARNEYDRALKADPVNRNALLGLATLDVRVGDYDRAAANYARVLELDPRDPDAAAGLIALRGSLDPVQAESRLKTLLAGQPDSAVLNFALGNVLAMQSRWAEAQQAYFHAVAAEPENPDYEFNLAVSLDQLHKEKLALEHYQRALALAASRPAGFNKSQAEVRIRDLQR